MKGSRISAWRVLGRVFFGLLVVIHRAIYSDRGQLITLLYSQAQLSSWYVPTQP